MKIRKVNELYKKTYLSASDKLSRSHPGRAARLRKWAEGAIPEPVERVFPHEFMFTDYSDNDSFLGRFFITSCEMGRGNASGYASVNIFFRSDYGKDIMINYAFSTKGDIYSNMKLHFATIDIHFTTIDKFSSQKKWETMKNSFQFNNRKDAIQFKKFLIEEVAEELNLGDYLNNEMIPINSLYYTT